MENIVSRQGISIQCCGRKYTSYVHLEMKAFFISHDSQNSFSSRAANIELDKNSPRPSTEKKRNFSNPAVRLANILFT